MTHIIDIPPDYAPYNAIAKGQWVRVDGKNKEFLPAATEADVPAAIARRLAELEEEDRRREEEQAARPKTYSKLRLYAALAQAGLWDTLAAWLQGQTVDGVNAYTAFLLAQDLTSDHPLFASWLAAAKAALGVDDATAAAILAAAEVTEG